MSWIGAAAPTSRSQFPNAARTSVGLRPGEDLLMLTTEVDAHRAGCPHATVVEQLHPSIRQPSQRQLSHATVGVPVIAVVVLQRPC